MSESSATNDLAQRTKELRNAYRSVISWIEYANTLRSGLALRSLARRTEELNKIKADALLLGIDLEN